jgi:hypothetical protein
MLDPEVRQRTGMTLGAPTAPPQQASGRRGTLAFVIDVIQPLKVQVIDEMPASIFQLGGSFR